MRVKVGAAILWLVLATTAAAATPGKPQHFTSFVRSDKEAPATFPGGAPTGATLFVATDASEGDFFLAALNAQAKAKFDAFRFEHRFLIGVVLTTRTSGYSVTIKRIGLQRVTPSRRQFCVVAAITKPAPGQAVVSHLWLAMHAVSLSADPYRV